MKKKKLGEVLRDKGKISSADLQTMIGEQTGKAIHLGELILERGLVAKEDLASALEEISGVLYLDCATIVPEPAALELIPHAMAERLSALPIRIERKRLVVAMASPQNLGFLDELRFAAGMDISPRLSFREELHQAILTNYGPNKQGHDSLPNVETQENFATEEMEFFSTSSRQSNVEAIQELQADLRQKKTPAVRLVSEILQTAMAKNASDVHIEPRAGETIIRIRVDGVGSPGTELEFAL